MSRYLERSCPSVTFPTMLNISGSQGVWSWLVSFNWDWHKIKKCVAPFLAQHPPGHTSGLGQSNLLIIMVNPANNLLDTDIDITEFGAQIRVMIYSPILRS